MTLRDFFEKYADCIMPEPNSGCFIWLGSTTAGGYGNLTRDGASHYAHRAAFEAANGAGSASGVLIRHRCDNPPCCNPDHLLSGTHADNYEDARQRGLLRQVRGEQVSTAVLTEQDVKAARDAAAAGDAVCEIADRYSISHSAADALIKGRSWHHLPGAIAAPESGTRKKLRRADAVEIRRLLSAGVAPAIIADRFSIGKAMVSAIKVGRAWKGAA